MLIRRRGWQIGGAVGLAISALLTTPVVHGQDKGPPTAAPRGLKIALDPSFAGSGLVADFLDPKDQTGALGRFLAVDRAGRPVIAGNSPGQRFSVARYTLDGKPDAAFAAQGKTSVCIEDAATVEAAGNAEVQFTHSGVIDAQGRIVIIGKGAGADSGRRWDFALLRFLPTGKLDTTFAEVGYRQVQVHEAWNIGLAVAALPDCSLLAAGYAQASPTVTDPLLIRLTESGKIDEAFSAAANGSLRWLAKEGTPATATSVAIDGQGRCLVGLNLVKENRPLWGLARLTASGEIDDSFADQGLWCAPLDPKAAAEMTFSTAVDSAGRIVMGGYSDDGSGFRRLAVARITSRGQLDPSFGPSNNGHVILSDYGSEVTYRYGPRAAVSKDRIAITGSVNGAKLGTKCFGLGVLDESGKRIGKIEPRLFPGGKGTDQPWGVAFDSEGRVVVGDASQAVSGKWRFAVARYVVE